MRTSTTLSPLFALYLSACATTHDTLPANTTPLPESVAVTKERIIAFHNATYMKRNGTQACVDAFQETLSDNYKFSVAEQIHQSGTYSIAERTKAEMAAYCTMASSPVAVLDSIVIAPNNQTGTARYREQNAPGLITDCMNAFSVHNGQFENTRTICMTGTPAQTTGFILDQ